MEFARRTIAFAMACVAMLTISACGGDGDGDGGAQGAIVSITVSADSLTVGTAATQSFTATARDSSGKAVSGVSFSWFSSNSGIAAIGRDGVVTGVAPGVSHIIASAQGVSSNAVTVTVIPSTRITGTAAIGAPISGAAITLKDRQGARRTVTTGANGLFVISTTGLQPPFLLRLESSAGASAPLYSASAGTANGVINVTPFTDLIVRSWYGSQDISIDAAFADPSRNPSVSADSLQLVHTAVLSAAWRWIEAAGVDTATFNLFSSAFDADGTGLDQVLDRTTVDIASGTLVITDGTTTQSSVLSSQSAPPSLTVQSTVSGPTASNSWKTETLLALQPEEQAAINGVNALLVEVGEALATATPGPNANGDELEAFFGAEYLNAGIERGYDDTLMVQALGGCQVSHRLRSIEFLDAAAGVMTATFDRTMSRPEQGSRTEKIQYSFKRYGTDWLFHGDQRRAGVAVLTEARNYQGAITSGSGAAVVARMSTHIQITPHPARGATVSGGGLWNNAALSPSQNPIYLTYFLDSGPLSAPLPAGTPFTMAVIFDREPTAIYELSANSFTTERIAVTNLTSHALADALGRTFAVEWNLPKSYAVQTVRLTRSWHLQHPNTAERLVREEDGPLLPATATAGNLEVRADYNGYMIVVGLDVNVIVEGVNGERSVAIYSFR